MTSAEWKKWFLLANKDAREYNLKDKVTWSWLMRKIPDYIAATWYIYALHFYYYGPTASELTVDEFLDFLRGIALAERWLKK